MELRLGIRTESLPLHMEDGGELEEEGIWLDVGGHRILRMDDLEIGAIHFGDIAACIGESGFQECQAIAGYRSHGEWDE